jgi:hypothetical protein
MTSLGLYFQVRKHICHAKFRCPKFHLGTFATQLYRALGWKVSLLQGAVLEHEIRKSVVDWELPDIV